MAFRIKKFAGRSQRTMLILLTLIATALIAGSISVIRYRQPTSPVQTINYSEAYAIAESGAAASVLVESDSLIVKRSDGTVFQTTVTGEAFRQTIVELFRKNRVPVEFASTQPTLIATVFIYSWPVLVVLLLGLVGWRVHATVNGRGGSFSLADHSGKQGATFADVAGVSGEELLHGIEVLPAIGAEVIQNLRQARDDLLVGFHFAVENA